MIRDWVWLGRRARRGCAKLRKALSLLWRWGCGSKSCSHGLFYTSWVVCGSAIVPESRRLGKYRCRPPSSWRTRRSLQTVIYVTHSCGAKILLLVVHLESLARGVDILILEYLYLPDICTSEVQHRTIPVCPDRIQEQAWLVI